MFFSDDFLDFFFFFFRNIPNILRNVKLAALFWGPSEIPNKASHDFYKMFLLGGTFWLQGFGDVLEEHVIEMSFYKMFHQQHKGAMLWVQCWVNIFQMLSRPQITDCIFSRIFHNVLVMWDITNMKHFVFLLREHIIKRPIKWFHNDNKGRMQHTVNVVSMLSRPEMIFIEHSCNMIY